MGIQVAIPWSHSKYISPDSAQPPPPAVDMTPVIGKSPPALILGSMLGAVIVTPVILVAIPDFPYTACILNSI